jgi:hypothetical protein
MLYEAGDLGRQGDILVERVAEIPKSLKQVDGRKVLAEGEATGHVHELVGEADLFRAEDIAEMEESFMRVDAEAAVEHAEHGAIPLPPADYQATRQRQYAPEAPVYVGD